MIEYCRPQKGMGMISAMIKTILVIATLLVLFSNCSRSGQFNDLELRWIKPYKRGDTIVFRSTALDLDTTFIESIEVSGRDDYGEIIRYRTVWCKNKSLFHKLEAHKMVSLIKYEDG